MKKSLLLLVFLVLMASLTVFPQVSINPGGVPADPSAMLDVNAPDKGLLIPRVSLNGLDNSADPVMNPATGLLIYNVEGNSYEPGIYIWSGSTWTPLATMEQVINTIPNFAEAKVYGEIYEFHPSGSFSTINIPAAGTWVAWSSGTPGDLLNMGFSASTLIANMAGYYKVSYNSAINLNKAGSVVDVAVFVNSVRRDDLSTRQWLKEANKPFILALSGILHLDANDVVSICYTMDDDESIRIETANLNLSRIN